MSEVLAARWNPADDTVLLDGFHTLKHALRFGAEVPIAVTADRAAALRLAAELAPDVVERLEALLVEVGVDGLARLVARPHPTGVAALARRPATREPVPGAPVVVLDDPRHLGNIGAVIRLAAGLGAGGVITTGSVDPWHPNVLRAAAGLHFATAVVRREVTELPDDRPLYGLDPAGADIRTVAVPADAVFAFGSERAGLSAEVRGRAEALVSLPMRGGVSSYNLATSVGMVLFHVSPPAVP
ncbi:TrmH family RNA methyltransferase [Streptomyces sp. 8K308]|uniref:TrmH family RNA methyltransferase n=1 Tax=Streptomyces sp. 8K308 TaxID=2530388 RepID=UPI00104BCCE4|nr:TrmH family RNA methyltransferase [Streptomyces sp. 8K308]TDC20901.1 TrmH family RNA methyltransferase [Streptomyces sp. 8K308]